MEGGNKEPKKSVPDSYYVRLALRIAADFGASIAVPAVLAAFAGTWLDERFGTKPLLIIVCLIAAFTLTGVVLVRKAKEYSVLYNRD